MGRSALLKGGTYAYLTDIALNARECVFIFMYNSL